MSLIASGHVNLKDLIDIWTLRGGIGREKC